MRAHHLPREELTLGCPTGGRQAGGGNVMLRVMFRSEALGAGRWMLLGHVCPT